MLSLSLIVFVAAFSQQSKEQVSLEEGSLHGGYRRRVFDRVDDHEVKIYTCWMNVPRALFNSLHSHSLLFRLLSLHKFADDCDLH